MAIVKNLTFGSKRIYKSNGGNIPLGSSSNKKRYDEDLIIYLDAGLSESYGGTGTTWYDLSGNDNHATLVNSPSYSTQNGGMITFNGTTQYADFQLNNPGGEWVHSIEFILRPSINQSAIGGTGSRDNPFSIGLSNGIPTAINRSSSFEIYTDIINWYFYANDTRLNGNIFLANTNYHIVLIYDGGGSNFYTKRMYINGVFTEWDLIYGTNYNDPLNIPANATGSIGRDRDRNQYYYQGALPYFRVYDKKLEDFEILSNFDYIRGRYGL